MRRCTSFAPAARTILTILRLVVPRTSESSISTTSLSYITLDGLLESVGQGRSSYCTSCYTGQYPVEFPRNEAAYLQLTLKPLEQERDPVTP